MVICVLALLLMTVGCAGTDDDDDDDVGSGGFTVEETDFTEGTLASSAAPGRPAAAPAAPAVKSPAATVPADNDEARDQAGVVLRVEGAPQTRFSGLCSVGGEESVVTGRVPKRYALEGRRPLTCRIQKQDSGPGILKVILLAGQSTRSVQQTDVEGGTLRVSYPGD